MIGCFNCPILGVQLRPTVRLHHPITYSTEWFVKNKAAAAPITFKETVMVNRCKSKVFPWRTHLNDQAWEMSCILNSQPLSQVWWFHFTVACLVAKPLNRSEAKVDLVMIQTLLSNANYLVIMLTRYWSLSQQGHLSFTLNQRLGNLVHNCEMAHFRLNTLTTKDKEMAEHEKYC